MEYFAMDSVHDSEPKKTKKMAFNFKDGVNTTFAMLNAWGFSHTVIVDLPSFASAVNATLGICNSDDDDLYTYETAMSSGTAGARNKYVIEKEVPLFGLNKIRLSLSGDPNSSNRAYITLYYKRNAAR